MSDEPAPQWRPKWLVPLLIGLVTVTAGFFTWRAGQLGSSAAFADRSSVGQTIRSEEQDIEATLAAIDDAVTYVGYVADFAEATALDSIAAELEAAGRAGEAERLRVEATELREVATSEATAAGVFGQQTALAARATGSTEPLPFDFDTQRARLLAEFAVGIRSPGELDPQRWADEADDIRVRVRDLRVGALVLVAAVAALTTAELGRHRGARWAGMVSGSAAFLVTTVVEFVTAY